MLSPSRRSYRTYSASEKLALVTEIERRYRAGAGALAAIARELGISTASYHNWIRRGIRPAPLPVMRPVEITALVPIAAPAPVAIAPSLVLVTPAGHRIEGLSVETAAALVRALS